MRETTYTRTALDLEAKRAFKDIRQKAPKGVTCTYESWSLVINQAIALVVQYGLNGVPMTYRIFL